MAFSRNDYDSWILLGEGSEARVFRARQINLNRFVAIREIKSNQTHVQNAAKLMASLRHQGLASLLDYGEENGTLYLVQDYVQGIALNKLAPVPPPVAFTLLRTLVQTLSYLHRQGLLHGDLHPGNMIATQATQAVLVDFGSVHKLGEPSGPVIGAPRYFSPEHIEQKPLLIQSDIFSCGSLLYFLLTGQDLFSQERYTDLSNALLGLKKESHRQNLALQWSDLPEESWPILDQCLRFNPQDRPEEMDELDELLEIAFQKVHSRLGMTQSKELQEAVQQKIQAALAIPVSPANTISPAAVLHSSPQISTSFPFKRSSRIKFFWVPAAILFAIILGAYVLKPPPGTRVSVKNIGNEILKSARTEELPDSTHRNLRLVTLPDPSRYEQVLIDEELQPEGTDMLHLAPGNHTFQGNLKSSRIWKNATVYVPDTGLPEWTWTADSTGENP